MNKKRKLLITIFAFLPFGGLAQSGNFSIKGKIGNWDAPATIFLYYHTAEGENFKDSSIMTKGNFELKGFLKSPVRGAQIILFKHGRPTNDDNNNGTILWLEPGLTEINSADSLRKANISGSKLNADEAVFEQMLKPYHDEQVNLNSSVSNEIYKNPGSAAFKAFQKKDMEILKQSLPVYRQFILSNPNSLVSIAVLTDYGGLKYGTTVGLPEIEPLFNSLSSEIKNSVMGEKYREQLAKWKSVDVGNIAPDFTLSDQRGHPVKLSDFKGKYVLLDFWASWCHPCRDENPNLIKQYNLYRDKNFTILSVSLDTKKFREDWLKAIKQDGLTWTQVMGDVENNEARLKYGVLAIPDNFLISPEGKVLAKSLRGEDLNLKLKQILDK